MTRVRARFVHGYGAKRPAGTKELENDVVPHRSVLEHFHAAGNDDKEKVDESPSSNTRSARAYNRTCATPAIRSRSSALTRRNNGICARSAGVARVTRRS